MTPAALTAVLLLASVDDLFQVIDTDRDGKVTRDELIGYAREEARRSTEKEGIHYRAFYIFFKEKWERFADHVMRDDAGGDGVLSRTEFQAQKVEAAARKFCQGRPADACGLADDALAGELWPPQLGVSPNTTFAVSLRPA